jgi:parvulin-like peptidyl-prolyl isomerase
MMRCNAAFICAVLFLLTVLSGVLVQPADADNKILVVVNDDVITEEDLSVGLNQIISDLQKEYSGNELKAKTEEARKEYLNQMIEDKLILQEAKRRGVIVDESEIEDRFKEVKSKFPSEEVFYSEVQKAGLSTEVLKKRYKDNIMMGRLVSHEVKDKVVVTPFEIEQYYKEHSQELISPEAVHIRTIMLRYEGKESEALTKQKADDIMRLIKEGRDFGELAKLYSQGIRSEEGGDFGFVEKGQMREDFDNVIFSLKEGEVSAPLKTDTGYFIFKVEEKRQSKPLSMAEARDDIENTIYRQKAQKRYEEWMAKLKRDAFIQIK